MTPENLTTFFSDPTILFICGLVILTGTLMLRIFRRKKTFEKGSFHQEFKVFPQHPNISVPTFGHTLPSTVQTDQIRKTIDQWEVDILNLTRQQKAEIDTKMVALQLLTAEATRQAQKLEQLISQAQGSLLFQDTIVSAATATSANATGQEYQHLEQKASPPLEPLITETEFPEEIKVEDPFIDPDFEKTREELEQFSNRLADLDLGLPDPFQAIEDTIETIESTETPPEMEVQLISQDQPEEDSHIEPSVHSKTGEQLGRATILRGLFPEFDEINRKPAQKRPNITFSSKNTIHTPRPPQLETLLKSQQENTITSLPAARTATPTVEIPRTSSPQAENVFGETGLTTTEKIAQMGIKHDKHHQIRFLAEKGLTSRDIASFLDMTVGEVEMILSTGPTAPRYHNKVSPS